MRNPLNSGSASSDLIGAQCSPNTVHRVYDTWMLANGTGKALKGEQLPSGRWRLPLR